MKDIYFQAAIRIFRQEHPNLLNYTDDEIIRIAMDGMCPVADGVECSEYSPMYRHEEYIRCNVCNNFRSVFKTHDGFPACMKCTDKLRDWKAFCYCISEIMG